MATADAAQPDEGSVGAKGADEVAARLETRLLLSLPTRWLAQLLRVPSQHVQWIVPLAASIPVYFAASAASYLTKDPHGFIDHERPPGVALFSLLWIVALSIQRNILVPTLELVYKNCATGASMLAIDKWLDLFLSRRRQIIACAVVAVPGLLTLGFIDLSTNQPASFFYGGAFTVCVGCAYIVGCLAYSVIFLPTLLPIVVRQKIKMFWPDPEETPFVKEFGALMFNCSIVTSVAASLIGIGLYWLSTLRGGNSLWQMIHGGVSSAANLPPGSEPALYLAATWLLAVMAVLMYSVVRPHRVLVKMIQMERSRQLERIHIELTALGERLPLDGGDQKTFDALSSLADKIKGSSESQFSRRLTLVLLPLVTIVGTIGNLVLGIYGIHHKSSPP